MFIFDEISYHFVKTKISQENEFKNFIMGLQFYNEQDSQRLCLF